jgi:hypothetical protein
MAKIGRRKESAKDASKRSELSHEGRKERPESSFDGCKWTKAIIKNKNKKRHGLLGFPEGAEQTRGCT